MLAFFETSPSPLRNFRVPDQQVRDQPGSISSATRSSYWRALALSRSLRHRTASRSRPIEPDKRTYTYKHSAIPILLLRRSILSVISRNQRAPKAQDSAAPLLRLVVFSRRPSLAGVKIQSPGQPVTAHTTYAYMQQAIAHIRPTTRVIRACHASSPLSPRSEL